MIKLYNTMSRQVEEFRPLQDNHVKLYTCGPTVYNYLQIGNWIAYVRWDLLVRVLRASGYDVQHVMNITDVGHLVSDADEGEDKLEKGARREGKTAWEVADFYTRDFLASMRRLHIQMPTRLVKATDHIQEQIDLITQLEKKAYTYVIDDGVYFDTSKLDDYGKLARLKPSELRAGARVELNIQKRNITDFALWKFSPKGNERRDMEWESPWGKGFPGWHLECSAMAMKYLGETLDIHAGGIDHIPVHHTNEIAQSEAATGKEFAKLWLHSSFLTVDGQKLSKSLGNSYTLQDIVAKGFSASELRLLLLQSHYRAQANFTWESLQAAKNRLQGFQAMADLRFQPQTSSTFDVTTLEQWGSELLAQLQDDLNTPKALATLSEVEQTVLAHGISETDRPAFEHFLQFIDQLLGLGLSDSADITDAQKTLVAERQKARAEKDFSTSDTVRDELMAQGIGLRDTPHGVQWFRL